MDKVFFPFAELSDVVFFQWDQRPVNENVFDVIFVEIVYILLSITGFELPRMTEDGVTGSHFVLIFYAIERIRKRSD